MLLYAGNKGNDDNDGTKSFHLISMRAHPETYSGRIDRILFKVSNVSYTIVWVSV